MNQFDIENGMRTAFLDHNYTSGLQFRPQFIYNKNKGIKISRIK